MKKYGVIFDFDGTLADTSKGVLDSVEYALEKVGALLSTVGFFAGS